MTFKRSFRTSLTTGLALIALLSLSIPLSISQTMPSSAAATQPAAIPASQPSTTPATSLSVANDVEVTLTPEKPEVEIDEPLLVDVTYHNLGQGTYYFEEDHNGDFDFHAIFSVRDEHGKSLPYPYARAGVSVFCGTIMTSCYTLKPGNTVTIRRMLNESVRFPKPGTYSIEAHVTVTGPAKPGKQPPSYATKPIPATIRVKDFDKTRRAADIDALLAAYRRGDPIPADLPFGQKHLFFSGGKSDIARILAFFDEPRLIPFFLDVLESENINGYAGYGLRGISDRAAVLKAFEERLDHPEKHDLAQLIYEYLELRFPIKDMSLLNQVYDQRHAAHKVYRDQAIALFKADPACQYGHLASRLCDGTAADAFLIDYVLRSKPTMADVRWCASRLAKVELPPADEPLVNAWLDASDIDLRDAAMEQLIRLNPSKYLPLLQADSHHEPARFSARLRRSFDVPTATPPQK